MKKLIQNKIIAKLKSSSIYSDSRFKTVFERIKICFMIFIIYLILNLFHAGCPIKFLSGISCPGCGMTRAMVSVLRLDFTAAFYYHPLFFLAPVMLLLFLFEDFIRPNYYKTVWIIIIILFIATYFYRLIFTENNVVTIDTRSGLVLKLLQIIF